MHDAFRIPAIALAVSLVPLAVALVPRAGENVAVIASPFSDRGALAVMAAADGSLVATTRFSAVVIARADGPDFTARLHRSGAWLVLNARLLSGCLGLT